MTNATAPHSPQRLVVLIAATWLGGGHHAGGVDAIRSVADLAGGRVTRPADPTITVPALSRPVAVPS